MAFDRPDYYSLSSVPISITLARGARVPATGFIYCRGEESFLVTNKHVLSGLDTFTKAPISADGLPIGVEVFFHADVPAVIPGAYEIQQGNHQNWLHHRQIDLCDVSCLEIDVPEGAIIHQPQARDYEHALYRRPGADCFIVGYPIPDFDLAGFRVNRGFPVWKRGSIASEYEHDVFGLRAVLVDSATYSGMSGSPVFLRQYSDIMYDDGNGAMGDLIATEFIGVYSGRLHIDRPDNGRATASQIGIVWRRNLIDEILG